jgi:hypothetical protein
MRPISVPVHALIDYPLAVAMLLAPSGFGFGRSGVAEDLAIRGIGAAFLLLCLATRYDLGLLPLLSMRSHRNVETLTGLVLILVAFAGRFSARAARVYVAFGIGLVCLALLTHIGRREELAFGRRHARLRS